MHVHNDMLPQDDMLVQDDRALPQGGIEGRPFVILNEMKDP